MKSMLLIVTAMIIISACSNNPYENQLGIKPSVIAQLDTANYTSIQWMDSIQNFGSVIIGAPVLIRFRFRNTGERPLFITEIQPSCGCTVVDYPQKALMPGKGGEVMARFDSRNHPGFIQKTITVTTNTSNRIKHVLLFRGQVTDSSKSSR